MNHREIRSRLLKLGDMQRAESLQRFFKTGPGEYGEGDIFLGIRVPEIRKLAKEHRGIPEKEILQLLKSPIHEERLLALLLFVSAYQTGDEPSKKRIYDLYLKHSRFINNWDLVDLSAGHIVGAFLMDKDRAPLYRLAGSTNVWERRISVISTSYFIKRDDYADTLKISEMLLFDREDLVHKAVGWMLREVGKRHIRTEERFLRAHHSKMPRTMLRYAIERFPEFKRKAYLKSYRHPVRKG